MFTYPVWSEHVDVVLPGSAVAWWELDESSGSRFDAKNNVELKEVNNTSGASVSSTTGKVGDCPDFITSGVNALGTDVGDIVIDASNDFAVACWVNRNNSNPLEGGWLSYRQHDTYGDRTQSMFSIGQDNSYNLTGIGFSGSSSLPITTGHFLPANTWRHVVFWWDAAATTIGVRINDSASYTRNIGGPLNTPTNPRFWVGTSDGVVGYINSLCDQVILFDSIPSGSFITELYNGGSGKALAGF